MASYRARGNNLGAVYCFSRRHATRLPRCMFRLLTRAISLMEVFGRASNLLICLSELPQVLRFRIPESPPILGRLHFARAHCGLRMNDGETSRLFLRQVLTETAALCKAGFGGKRRNALCCPLAAVSDFLLYFRLARLWRSAARKFAFSCVPLLSLFTPRRNSRKTNSS